MPGLPEQTHDSETEALIAEHQPRLYRYLLALVARPEVASDLLQETNLVLWEKRDAFTPGSNFGAWAKRIAYFEAVNYRRRCAREGKAVAFDDTVFAAVAQRSDEREREHARHRRLLQICLEKLPVRQRDFVEAHYFQDQGVGKLAADRGMKANSVAQLLFRARANLIACVKTHSHLLTEEPFGSAESEPTG